MKNNKWLPVFCVLLMLLTAISSQGKQSSEKKAFKYNEDMYKAMQWRCIGPYRGGRATAVAGIPGQHGVAHGQGADEIPAVVI